MQMIGAMQNMVNEMNESHHKTAVMAAMTFAFGSEGNILRRKTNMQDHIDTLNELKW